VEAPVDRRGSEPAVFHPCSEQLDVWTRCLQHVDVVVGCPLEVAAQIMAVRLQRPPAVASEERHRRQPRVVDIEPGAGSLDRCGDGLDRAHR
jgi:hypothetical protein